MAEVCSVFPEVVNRQSPEEISELSSARKGFVRHEFAALLVTSPNRRTGGGTTAYPDLPEVDDVIERKEDFESFAASNVLFVVVAR